MSKLIGFTLENTDIHHSITTDMSDITALKASHCHDRYEILYVASGAGRCIVEGNELVLTPGTVVLTSPFEYHHVEVSTQNLPYERWCIHFPKDYLAGDGARILDAITKYNEGKGNFYPPTSLSSEISSIFERLKVAVDFPERQKNSYIKLLTSELFVLLSLSRPHQEPAAEELGARVIHYLNENIDKDVSLDTLSKKFFVSKYYLCRSFKKYNGVSIHGYVNYKRIVYAKHLIDSGEPASAAAYTVGFGDYSAFYRAYVKIIGTSPTKHAQNEQNTQDGEARQDLI